MAKKGFYLEGVIDYPKNHPFFGSSEKFYFRLLTVNIDACWASIVSTRVAHVNSRNVKKRSWKTWVIYGKPLIKLLEISDRRIYRLKINLAEIVPEIQDVSFTFCTLGYLFCLLLIDLISDSSLMTAFFAMLNVLARWIEEFRLATTITHIPKWLTKRMLKTCQKIVREASVKLIVHISIHSKAKFKVNDKTVCSSSAV